MTDDWTPDEIAACRRRVADPLGTGRLDRVETRRALDAIVRLTDERDRARATAVALEQQSAEAERALIAEVVAAHAFAAKFDNEVVAAEASGALRALTVYLAATTEDVDAAIDRVRDLIREAFQ